MRLRSGIAAIGIGVVVACASAPPPVPGRVTLWGTVEIVPREGVLAADSDADSYGRRVLRDATLVDYSRPGFAVVWVEGEERGERIAPLRVVASGGGPRLEPRHVAVGGNGRIRVANETSDARIVSVPSLGVLRRLAAGASFETAIAEMGEHAVYLLDAPETSATVFAAAGPFAVVSPRGAWALEALHPGAMRVHVWHPRLPSVMRELTAGADEVRRIDFRLGVDSMRERSGARD
jgi:hypothetical protein